MAGSRQLHLRPGIWAEHNQANVRGSAFVDGNLLSSLQLAQRFTQVVDKTGLIDLLNRANGFFAVILRLADGSLLAATDRARSIPLFYAATGERAFLSDDAYWIRDQLPETTHDSEAQLEFSFTGYVTGSDTLHPSIKQLRCAELLFVHPNKGAAVISTERYYRYIHQVVDDPGAEGLLTRLDETLVAAIARLIQYADGRQIALPLTGGLDSGRIAMALKRERYPHLLGFSYGVPGNPDALSGERMARRLSIPWAFTPYSAARWRRWFSSPERKRYYRYADHLCTLPVLQDWPAVWELKEIGIIKPTSVIVPGYSAECFNRPHPTPPDWPPLAEDRWELDAVADATVLLHYSLREWSGGQQALAGRFRQRMLSAVDDPQLFGCSAALYEFWAMNERQAKFITNAVRAYEFWDCDWWLPLWDNAIMDFWQRVPVKHRLGRRLSTAHFQQLCQLTCGDVLVPYRQRLSGSVMQYIAAGMRRAGKHLPPIRRAYNFGRALLQYKSHPLAWHGLVHLGDFLRHYRGRVNINTYLAMEWLDEISFHSD